MSSSIPTLIAGALWVAASCGIASTAMSAETSDAEAQPSGGLNEVVVTAQRRSENIQDVPLTVTALSGEEMASRGVTNTESLSMLSPGVLVSEPGSNPDQTVISIRGVTQLDFGDQQESPNAIYIDGAYLALEAAAGFGFFDTKDIEILRGPQGTLFGRNATGGLVQITSNKPTDYFSGYLQAGQGSYNQHRVEGAVSGPLSSDLTARFSFLYNQQDPYIDNDLGPSFGADKAFSGRLQFQYKLNDSTTDLLQITGSRTFPIAAGVYFPYATGINPDNHGLAEKNNGALFVQTCAGLGITVEAGATNCSGYHYPGGNRWSIEDPRIGFLKRTVAGGTNTLTHEMGWATLTSITNYTYFSKHYLEDDGNGPTPTFAFTSDVNAYQASEELRLSGATERLKWQAGAFYLAFNGNYDAYVLSAPFDNQFKDPFVKAGPIYHQDVTTYALFDQVDFDLSRGWTFTVGGRIEKDMKRLDLTQTCGPTPENCAAAGTVTQTNFISGNISNIEWSGNVQLSYKPSANLMFYGGVRRGTRDGELTIADFPIPGQDFNSLVIKPEILVDTEGGFKSTLLEHHLQLNGDVFYYHYQDYQAFKTLGIAPVLFNAQARDYGAELTSSALITDTVTANIGIAYLHTKVRDVALPDGTFADQEQANAPHWSVTSNLRKEWKGSFGKFFTEASAVYVGSRYFSTVNQDSLRAPAYVTANASLGYTDPSAKWTATLSVTNLNNKAYEVQMFDNSSTAAYGMRSFAPPRWVLGQIRYNF